MSRRDCIGITRTFTDRRKAQVLGGASGALIVEGIERANPALAGLPERVFVIRDQDLLNPDAEPVKTDSMPPPLVLRDAEGDIMNTGTGGGKPAKDLSINFVPVAFPKYVPAVIKMRPGEKQHLVRVERVGDHVSRFADAGEQQAADDGRGLARRSSRSTKTETTATG